MLEIVKTFDIAWLLMSGINLIGPNTNNMLINIIICYRQRWNKLEQTLFERALSILYSNRLSRLTYEGTVQEYVQKIICTEKSVAEMHHLLTNYTHWDISLT